MDAVEFWNLGLSEPIPISAYHGDGTGDLLDEVVKVLPDYPIDEEKDDSVAIAIVGRPNVGKSSLLNTMVGEERSIVSNVPGTTRDPIDTQLVYDGQPITLIDTAGIRRRGRVERGIEQYSVLRSMRSIDRADVALLLIDATDGVTEQDAHVAGYVLERMKGVVVVVNKWDAVEKDTNTMNEFTKQIRTDLKFLDYVPVVFISAKTGQRVANLLPVALSVAEARKYRMGTSELNNLIREVYDAVPPPSKNGRQLRIYYATQADTEPPTFILFVNDPDLVHFSYERYLENRIREHHPFTGTPIRLVFRMRGGDQEKN
jgi:GTP-binding protein